MPALIIFLNNALIVKGIHAKNKFHTKKRKAYLPVNRNLTRIIPPIKAKKAHSIF
jgi:hypothetical protein